MFSWSSRAVMANTACWSVSAVPMSATRLGEAEKVIMSTSASTIAAAMPMSVSLWTQDHFPQSVLIWSISLFKKSFISPLPVKRKR